MTSMLSPVRGSMQPLPAARDFLFGQSSQMMMLGREYRTFVSKYLKPQHV